MDINDQMLSAIDNLIKQVKENSDPAELKEFKKLSKRAIPMGIRKEVNAFLFKEYLKNNKAYSRGANSTKSFSKNIKTPEIKDGVTLFMGVGKNRRVYPKDIIHLFINTGKVERETIGDIRILDNYSFITVNKDAADKIISNLNGINYRGRSLNINYAKKS